MQVFNTEKDPLVFRHLFLSDKGDIFTKKMEEPVLKMPVSLVTISEMIKKYTLSSV